ncbi:MAG TPA: protein kinase, partial [Kofleriaceae bacterium]|nr:protein kinase [Kofleriaceae bacterium]
ERVALKVLRGGLSEEAIERFRREVRLTRRIQHRNVARMYDIGEHHGDKFLTMELIDGQPLTRELGGPLPWAKLQSYATQICSGLAAAHKAGVVHRDLKPDNVLIERGTDRVVITDFGIARSGDDESVTQVGVVIGTPRYMAPEQLAGTDVDARADIFSLGVMLFEMASGKRPWSGDNAIAIAVAQATQPMRELEPGNVPSAFIEVVKHCLAIDRADRPASAEEVEAAIAACVHSATEISRAARVTRAPVPTPAPTPTLAPTPPPASAATTHARVPHPSTSTAATHAPETHAEPPLSTDSHDPLVQARALLDKGDTGGALAILEKELLDTPGRPALYALLGDARNRTGNRIAAIAAYRRYLALIGDADHSDRTTRVRAKLQQLGGI